MKTSCSLPLLRTAIRHLSHPGRRAQSAGLTPAIILPGQHYNPAALRGHTPVLTAGWRRRFRRRPKRSPDGSEAGPRAEPHGGAAETDGEAARAPQPGGAARLPPARHGCRARRGAPPERATPGSSRRKARPPRPLPARLAASRARPEPRRGPATRDSLRPTFPVRRSARPRSPAAHGTGPPTPTGKTVTRGYGREPAPAACAIQTAPRCMLGRAPPRSASARAVPEQSALWRPRRSRPPARAALCGGARPQGSGGAVVARGGRPGPSDARQCPPRASRRFLQPRLVKRGGGEGWLRGRRVELTAPSLHSGVAHHRESFLMRNVPRVFLLNRELCNIWSLLYPQAANDTARLRASDAKTGREVHADCSV